MVQIKLENCSIGYPNYIVLKNCTLDIKGKIIGIVGANGIGKTTLLKGIAGTLAPQNGKIELLLNREQKSIQGKIAFVPEEGSVFYNITVKEYLQFWSKLKLGSFNIFLKEKEILQRLDIYQLLSKKGIELSKGEKRRVQFAISILIKPSILLLDEPFDGLDVKRANEMGKLILDYKDKINFIISSHRMDILEEISDAIILLKKGGVFSFGSIEDIKHLICNVSYLIKGEYNLLRDIKKEIVRKFSPIRARFLHDDLKIIGKVDDLQQLKEWLAYKDVVFIKVPISLNEAISYFFTQYR